MLVGIVRENASPVIVGVQPARTAAGAFVGEVTVGAIMGDRIQLVPVQHSVDVRTEPFAIVGEAERHPLGFGNFLS